MPKGKSEPVYQASADDEALQDHTEDDQCAVSHRVYRPCTHCGKLETEWMPYIVGYWCTDCQTCFDTSIVVYGA